MKNLKVTVQELKDDTPLGYARINYEIMDLLGATTEDVIEITGKNRTHVKCRPTQASDIAKGAIRINSFTRKNTTAHIGDIVTIKKIKTSPIKKISLTSLKKNPSGAEKYLADALDEVPVTEGDELFAPYFDEGVLYKVTKVYPSGVGILTQKTKFQIDGIIKDPSFQ